MESSDTFDIREHAWSVKIKTSQFVKIHKKILPIMLQNFLLIGEWIAGVFVRKQT